MQISAILAVGHRGLFSRGPCRLSGLCAAHDSIPRFVGQGERGIFQRDRGRRSHVFFISLQSWLRVSPESWGGT